MPGDPTATVIGLSRQVMGEIPAVLLLYCGLWLISQPYAKRLHYGMAGLVFGVATAIKSQVLLILTFTIIVWSAYQLFRQRSMWPSILLLTVVMFGFYGLDWSWRSSMASSQAEANTAVLLDGIRIHILPFRVVSNLAEPGTIARLGVVIAGLILFGAVRWRSPGSHLKAGEAYRHIEDFLVIFTVLWFSWWAFASIGWQRYAFVGFTVFVPLLAYGINWLWERVQLKVQSRKLSSALLILTVPLVVFFVTRDWLFEDRRGDEFLALIDYLKHDIPENIPIVT